MMSDPIADFLIRIKNASMARKKTVEIPYSRVKKELSVLLAREGYVEAVEESGEGVKRLLRLTLKYEDQMPILTDVKRKSKPGLRIYVGRSDIRRVVGGMGIAVISTPQGIMTGNEAKKRGIGGELLFEIW